MAVIDYTPYLSCSDPYAHRSIITAIVKVESGGNPWAININSKNGVKLVYQAKTLEQAQAWVRWFAQNGYNIDIGLAQINIKNINKYKLDPTTFLEPCTNLAMAGKILKSNYDNASKSSSTSDDAIKKAISAYNTGNFRYGFANGYVGKVMAKYYGQPILKNTSYAMIPPLNTGNSNPTQQIKVRKKNSGEPVNENIQLAQNTPTKKANFYVQPGIKVDLWGGRNDQQGGN